MAVCKDAGLADDEQIVPGIVSHSTNVIEHPELVADRIEKFATLVGPERVTHRPTADSAAVQVERLCSTRCYYVPIADSVDPLLPAVASALADNLGASLQEIADAAGVGRTTLHRHFPTRQTLTDAVAQHAVRECERVMDVCGVDDLAVPEVLDRLSREVLPLAVAYALIYAEPPITSQTEDLQAEAELQDNRFERFAARGQAEGHFRSDVPSRWIVYSIGLQAMAVWLAVRAGVIATRDVERLFLTTVLSGLSAGSSNGVSSP